jgi:hypothetical protein
VHNLSLFSELNFLLIDRVKFQISKLMVAIKPTIWGQTWHIPDDPEFLISSSLHPAWSAPAETGADRLLDGVSETVKVRKETQKEEDVWAGKKALTIILKSTKTFSRGLRGLLR